MRKLQIWILMMFVFMQARAADADIFTRSGNYYVVAGVLLIILLGLLIYLARIDGRLRKLEKNNKS